MLPQKLIVGLTGLYASGKTTASQYFQEKGFHIIDMDLIGHQALTIKTPQIIQHFGTSILTDNTIDRKALGRQVFSNPKKLETLEHILHPLMRSILTQELHSNPSNRILISAAILFKMKLETLCHAIILIEAPEQHLLERAIQRDKLSPHMITERLKTQNTIKKHFRHVDFKINNDSSKEELRKRCHSIIELLLQQDLTRRSESK